MRVWTIMPLASLALLAGCVLPANVVVNLPDDGGQLGKINVSNASGNAELTKDLAAVGLEAGEPPGQPFITNQQAVRQVFGKVLEATPRSPVSFRIYFEPGSTLIVPASHADLLRGIEIAKTMGYPEISVIEHDDPISPVGQNDALLMARAQSVAGKLVSAGVDRAAIEIEYYGSATPHVGHSDETQSRAPVEVIIR